MAKGSKRIFETGQTESTLSIRQKQILVRKIEPFTLKNGELYKMGEENKL